MIEDEQAGGNRLVGSVTGPVVQAAHVGSVHFQAARPGGGWLAVAAAALASVTASSAWLVVYRATRFDLAGVEGVASAGAVVVAVALVLLVVRLGGRAGSRGHAVDVGRARAKLIAAVRAQWHGEWVERGMLRSSPLPVTWSTADRVDRTGLDGAATAFRGLPRRRLVVVGPGGSGKTVLAVRLTLDLLDTLGGHEPVPVPLALAQWDPERQLLRDWVAERLATDYGITTGADLVDAGAVLPVLDGLDELAARSRGPAVEALNAQLGPADPVVVTSRPDPVLAELAGVTTFALAPVDLADAVAHLGEDWRPVVAHGPVAAALTSPLMVALARAVPRPDDLLGLPDEAAVRAFLLETFVAETYADRARPAGSVRRPRHRGDGPRRWLAFLARDLERRTTTVLAWWHLRRALPRGHLELVVGAALGLVWGAAAALVGDRAIGLGVGPVLGLLFGAAFCAGYTAIRSRTASSGGDSGFRGHPTWSDLARRVANGGLAVAVAWAVALPVGGTAPEPGGDPVVGAVAGISAALLAGLLIGVVAGAWLHHADGLDQRFAPARARTPDSTRRRDRTATLVVGGVFAVVVGVVTGGAVAIVTGDPWSGAWAAAGGAVAGGPAAITVFTAWAAYLPARVLLALRRDLPWRLGAFLADAHRLEVLRQFGATYQFRHLALQQRLAEPSIGNGQSVR